VEEILNTADREECDMIILGSHGKGWLKQTFLGSGARSVMERTRKPIFLVPLPSEKAGIDWGTL
jgi:nucleotide-binding universal stress UspA family protein